MSGEHIESFAEVMQKIRSGGFGELADHIEAAHRRELSALRDAVVAARRVLAVWGDELPFRAWNEKGEALDRCDAALREGGNDGNE